MSVNLWSSIRNPFTRPSSSTRRFFVGLNVISLGAAVAVIASHHYGVSMLRVCYISQELNGVGYSSANSLIWLLFYGPVIVVWAGSSFVALNSYYRLKRGLRETFKARERAMQRARNFIISYSVYWFVLLVLYIAAQLVKNHSRLPGEAHNVTQLDAGNVAGAAFTLLFTSKSVITLVVRVPVSVSVVVQCGGGDDVGVARVAADATRCRDVGRDCNGVGMSLVCAAGHALGPCDRASVAAGF